MNASKLKTGKNDNKAIKKYLQQYSEPEIKAANQLLTSSSDKFQYCICVPFFDEPLNNFLRFIDWINQQSNILFITIINQPENIPVSSEENHLLFKTALLQSTQKTTHQNNLNLVYLSSGNALLVIDRFTQHKIPNDEGVGLARKIMADIACDLIFNSIIESPWIFCTDADVTLPKNYFEQSNKYSEKNTSAILFPYTHVGTGKSKKEEAIIKATQYYETYLTHYIDGLKSAGSPYAYHSLGSIIAVSYLHYANVRGFPRRAAGEDFYLLNKLRKLATIISLERPLLFIDARISNRTPFGTGPTICSLLEDNEQSLNQAKIFYHPELFTLLKKIISAFNHYGNEIYDSEVKKLTDFTPIIKGIFSENEYHAVVVTLNTLNYKKALSHCYKQGKDKHGFYHHLFIWFDAFKTLKFIHLMRENLPEYNNINYDALNSL